MSANKNKVLVFGHLSNREDLSSALAKANTVNSKSGPFTALILISDQLTSNDILATIPAVVQHIDIPTYIYVKSSGSSDNDAQEELSVLSPNITLLKATDIVKTTSGIIIATAFNVPDNNQPTTTKTATFTDKVDILFGNTVPANITAASDSILPESIPNDSATTALAMRLKPRYHFVSTQPANIYWERVPFTWEDESLSLRTCRFISLGKFGSDKKSAYAFNISSIVEPVIGAVTECPYTIKSSADFKKTSRADHGIETEIGQLHHQTQKNKNKKQRRLNATVVAPKDCFFCLSNPKVDKSLIISIADEAYIALAKGPLTSDAAKQKLGFSGHLILIPLAHVPTYSSLPPETKDKALLERRKYLIAIEQMLAQKDLSFVYYEICRDSGVHVGTQIIPLPLDKADELESAFLQEFRGRKMDTLRKVADHSNDTDFVTIQIAKKDAITVKIPPRERFDMFLCRKVIANVLGVPGQADWRACVQSEADERKDGLAGRSLFSPFEFSS